MADVFISYAREDRERVRPLAEALQALGFSVWWDGALGSGDDYTRVIERELQAAKVVVVVWTAVSVNASFVRDEAGRARDLGKLTPVTLDRNLQPPLGFGAFQAEDFSSWNGAAAAPQVKLLEESLRARIEGRAVNSNVLQARRREAASRIRLMSILGVIATLLVIAASVTVLMRKPEVPQASTQQDQLAQLLKLVSEGKITGDQALALAKLVQKDAFALSANSTAMKTEPTPLVAPPNASETERTAIAQAPPLSRDDMVATARAAFEGAAGALLIDPDQRVRSAILQTRMARTRSEGIDTLWSLAKEGGSSAAAIWRACGALMVVEGDPRAGEALENARTLNPQDKNQWRLLSYAYAQENKTREAAGAALVSEGIERAGSSDWSGARSKLDMALPLVLDPEAKGFVHSQIGDAAAAQQDLPVAEKHYRSAVDLHFDQKNSGEVSLNAMRLARTLVKEGQPARACATLRKARANGAAMADSELAQVCGPQEAPAQAKPEEVTEPASGMRLAPRRTVIETAPQKNAPAPGNR